MEVKTKPKFNYPLLPGTKKEKVVVLLSGGMDSTTLLYEVMVLGYEVYPITFYYRQKHEKEMEAAAYTCQKLGLTFRVLDISALNEIAPSSLTRDKVEVPKGHYEDESMKQTVVPNRNMVFLAFATAYAIGLDAEEVAYGAHGGDHAIYPDCRPDFVEAMVEAISLCDYKDIHLWVPYLHVNKADILRKGLELGVDYSLTWTCYEGQELACGRCGACTERLGAFREVGIEDPLKYKEA